MLNTSSSVRTHGWIPPELLMELATEDEGLIAELIDAFKNDTQARLQRIQTALSAGDLIKLRNEFHTIKGSSKQLGAETLAERCQELESSVLEMPLASITEEVVRLNADFQEIAQAMTVYSRSSAEAGV